MRYIRTKDGYVFDKNNLDTTFKGSTDDYYFWRKYLRAEHLNKHHFLKDKILKEADTIEELCDEFVDTSELKTTNTGGWLYDEFDSDNKCLVYYEHDERKTIPLNEFDDLSKIRGAIWTDKGLIYVAKMNEKGEMELL